MATSKTNISTKDMKLKKDGNQQDKYQLQNLLRTRMTYVTDDDLRTSMAYVTDDDS
jgi:hypothetical protein